MKLGHLCWPNCDKSRVTHPLILPLHFIPFLLLLFSYFKFSLETIHYLELF